MRWGGRGNRDSELGVEVGRGVGGGGDGSGFGLRTDMWLGLLVGSRFGVVNVLVVVE